MSGPRRAAIVALVPLALAVAVLIAGRYTELAQAEGLVTLTGELDPDKLGAVPGAYLVAMAGQPRLVVICEWTVPCGAELRAAHAPGAPPSARKQWTLTGRYEEGRTPEIEQFAQAALGATDVEVLRVVRHQPPRLAYGIALGLTVAGILLSMVTLARAIGARRGLTETRPR